MRAPAVPTIPGVTDFRSLLEFVRNGEAYDQALNALEAHQAECHRLIGQVAEAADLDRQRALAAADRNMAAEELRNAKAEAQRLTVEAQAAKEMALADVSEWRRRAEAEIATRSLELSVKEDAARSTISQGQHLMAAGREMKAEAETIRAEGQALKDEYEARLAKLKQKMAEVGIL